MGLFFSQKMPLHRPNFTVLDVFGPKISSPPTMVGALLRQQEGKEWGGGEAGEWWEERGKEGGGEGDGEKER